MTIIKSFVTADQFLGKKQSRPYAHNTRIVRSPDGDIEATYHDNVVATFHFYGVNEYSSCGWMTSTTKERLNWFLPDGFSIYQKNSVWFLLDRVSQEVVIFKDGLYINLENREVSGQAKLSHEDDVKKIIKRIKKYVDKYVDAFLWGEVEKPSNGDCFGCSMIDKDGNTAMSSDHLISHMDEDYFVPSLLLRAIERHNVCMLTKGTIENIWYRGGEDSQCLKDICGQDIKTSLTRYMKSQLCIAE